MSYKLSFPITIIIIIIICTAKCQKCRPVYDCCRRIGGGRCAKWCNTPQQICNDNGQEEVPLNNDADQKEEPINKKVHLISVPCLAGHMRDHTNKCRISK
jgi:hypothetical protein